MVHVHLEEGVALKGDNKIQTLSWMGKVPDMLPNEDGLKLDRDLYYQEGWLASGNGQGIVGVTFTSCHGVKSIDFPNRTNYNLTGHRNEVVMVRWNEPYQKLVTCDDKGVIFVWIRHEGRWSIELINDRHHKVTDFSWSHDGRMAVICYEDGFVLVGSVGGQRYWSSMLNLEDSHIAAGVWTPDDTKLLLGTSCGQVIVMGSTGAMLSQFELIEGMEISSMAWSCEKFNMEDAEEETDGNERARSRSTIDDCCKAHMLAVSFKYGAVLLMTNYDDVAYKTIHTGLVGLKIEWSNDGDLLACGGFVRQANLDCDNIVKLYCKDGNLKKVIHIPPTQVKPLLALTWGHSDRRLFISAGNCIYVAWVTKNVPTLQMLCRDALKTSLKDESLIQKLPLPLKVQHFVRETFEPTVQGVVPVPQKLRDFVIMPPPNGDRYYCTMIKHENVTYGDYWTLYLEHLGGLFPLLKARKSSKLRPEFVIFDPLTTKTLGQGHEDLSKSSSELSSYESDSNTVDIGCGSPKSQRKNRKRRKLNKLEKDLNNQKLETSDDPSNCLPERQTIVEVASNIWGTKFRIMGCVPYLPRDLGQVVYKSSLLHLQPRQMSLALTDLKDENYCHGNESQSSLCSEEDDEEAASSIQESGLISSRDGLNVVIVPEGSIAQAQFTDPNCASKPHNQVYLLQGASPPDGLNQHNRCDKHVQCDGVEDVPTDISTDECKDSLAIEGLACEATACSACNLAGEEFNQSNLSLSSNDSGYLGAFYKSQGAIPKTHVQNLQPNAPTNERKVRLQSRKEHNLINAMCKGCHRNESGNLCGLCRSTRPVDSSQNKGKIEDLHNMSSDLHRNLKFIDEDSEEEADVKQRTASLLKGSATSVPVEVIETDSVTQMDSIDKQNGEDSSRIISCCDSKLDEIVNCHKKRINSNGFTPINELKNSKNLKNSKFSKQGSVGATEVCAAVGIQLNADVGGGSSTSLPASPVKEDVPKQRSWSRERQLAKSSQSIESSDDEILLTGDELTTSYSYRDLESFQKAQLRQKMRKGRSKSDGERVVARRQFIMHNKAPLWNENNQVYQLDFGGRVTQESAKNFQIEFRGKQVMQFGRIDLNKYTLDYQYPFTGIQAFAVALANVTQRLK